MFGVVALQDIPQQALGTIDFRCNFSWSAWAGKPVPPDRKRAFWVRKHSNNVPVPCGSVFLRGPLGQGDLVEDGVRYCCIEPLLPNCRAFPKKWRGGEKLSRVWGPRAFAIEAHAVIWWCRGKHGEMAAKKTFCRIKSPYGPRGAVGPGALPPTSLAFRRCCPRLSRRSMGAKTGFDVCSKT